VTDIESSILKPGQIGRTLLVQEDGTAGTQEVPRFRSVDADGGKRPLVDPVGYN
jgi:hypothetical protein